MKGRFPFTEHQIFSWCSKLGEAWNLANHLGDDISRVKGVPGRPMPRPGDGYRRVGALRKGGKRSSLAANAIAAADDWRRRTPNLRKKDYLSIDLFLHYSSNRLVPILNNPGR